MGITNSNKAIDVATMSCDGAAKMVLALSAAPDISQNPVDIMLVLDRSGSMTGAPLASMKLGSKTFIDIIDESTDGIMDGNIGGGSRIGLVSFSASASLNMPLTTSVFDLKAAVDSLVAGGNTNHSDAFTTAIVNFDPLSANTKIIVMFTDGETTAGGNPSPIAAAARASGIEIYCIGLVGSSGIDVATLNDWATDPDASHVAVTPDEAELELMFEELAANITKPGATNILIDEYLNPEFIITSIVPPVFGTAMQMTASSLQWTIPALGTISNQGANLEFYIKHIGGSGGIKTVNDSIFYSDNEGNFVTFPTPTVEVLCDDEYQPEPCPTPQEFSVKGCSDAIMFDGDDLSLDALGRLVQVNVRLKNVCPNKRVALAVMLNEMDNFGVEHKRGVKCFTIPAHFRADCSDIMIKCIRFILPEDLDVSGGVPFSICNERNFKARFMAHYIDNDFECCNSLR